MAVSNLKIINELKKFLDEISEESEKRAKYVFSAESFSRKRLLSFQTIILVLLNGLKRSLSIELMQFFEQIPINKFCSKQAFSKQRRKLKSLFFHDWNERLTESFYSHSQYRTWNGFKLWAVDGSCVALPNTEEVRKTYDATVNEDNHTYPVARIGILYDVLNGIAIKGILHPYTVSEESVVLQLFTERDLTQSLLLFDRGYPSYWLMYLLIQKKTCFVMRASSNAFGEVEKFIASNETDVIREIYPSYKSLRKLRELQVDINKVTPIKLRLVKVLLSTGETEILITNLYDTVLYTPEDLKEVYYLRWGIETYYGYIKEELQLGQFSGISPVCIEQDFAANLFLFNLQSIIEKQCEPYLKEKVNGKRKYQYKVNKNVSWASLKYRVVKLFIAQEPDEILNELEILFCRYLEPIRPGRKYPRLKKRKPTAKHYTLTNYKRAM